MRELPGEGKFKLTQSDPSLPSFESSLIELTTIAVCAKCNHEWMSSLETHVAPLLRDAIKGGLASLPADQHKTLAVWAFKTAMMLDCAYGDLGAGRFIPDEHCRELYETERPRNASFFFTSSFGYDPNTQTFRDASAQRFTFAIERISDGKTVDGHYAVTWQFGYFLGQIVCLNTDEDLDSFRCADLPLPNGDVLDSAEFTRQIWPSPGETISWPAPTALEAVGMDIWANNAPFIAVARD